MVVRRKFDERQTKVYGRMSVVYGWASDAADGDAVPVRSAAMVDITLQLMVL